MTHSRRQIIELGERLRDSPDPTAEDLDMLADVLLEYDRALIVASENIRGIGLEATTRLKTSGTIIEKLSRERHLNLKSIRDLAGARIVQRMTLDEQDAITEKFLEIWPGAKLIDRREAPSHGYRAVHIVPRIGGCQVEIQLRTEYQDLWAQGMERLGDSWGRAIRYGGEPDDPDQPSSEGSSSTRRGVIVAWKSFANDLYELAKLENEIARLRQGNTQSAIERLEDEVNARFQLAKKLVEDLRTIFV